MRTQINPGRWATDAPVAADVTSWWERNKNAMMIVLMVLSFSAGYQFHSHLPLESKANASTAPAPGEAPKAQ